MKHGVLLGEPLSETPRTDAFIDALPPVRMDDPISAAHDVRALMIRWAEFARELEREVGRKVWPQ